MFLCNVVVQSILLTACPCFAINKHKNKIQKTHKQKHCVCPINLYKPQTQNTNTKQKKTQKQKAQKRHREKRYKNARWLPDQSFSQPLSLLCKKHTQKTKDTETKRYAIFLCTVFAQSILLSAFCYFAMSKHKTQRTQKQKTRKDTKIVKCRCPINPPHSLLLLCKKRKIDLPPFK